MSLLKVDDIHTRAGTANRGHIIQVVQSVNTNVIRYETNSFAAGVIDGTSNTGDYSITITPSSSTSKVLVSFQCMVDNNTANQRLYITVYRNNNNNVIQGTGAGRGLVEIWNPDQRIQSTVHAQYLDEPQTTSAVTYTVYAKRDNSPGGNVYLGLYGNQKFMTAMEVSA